MFLSRRLLPGEIPFAAGGEDLSIPTGASAQLRPEGRLGGLLYVGRRNHPEQGRNEIELVCSGGGESAVGVGWEEGGEESPGGRTR